MVSFQRSDAPVRVLLMLGYFYQLGVDSSLHNAYGLYGRLESLIRHHRHDVNMTTNVFAFGVRRGVTDLQGNGCKRITRSSSSSSSGDSGYGCPL